MESLLRIVAVTGMPGAGKSTASLALASRGWTRVVMGDVIRAETERRGLEPSSANTGEVMKLLRKERGASAVADLCMEAILRSGSDRVVVDGIRSREEVETFRTGAKVLVIAVHASPARRFELLKERGRSDDPLTFAMFSARDERELDVGIGEAIATSDEIVSNQRTSPERLAKEMERVVTDWEENGSP